MPVVGLEDKAHLAAQILTLRNIHPVLTEDPAFPLPQTAAVDFSNPQEIVQWAYWGETLCYPSREEFADAVTGGKYEQEVVQRLAKYRRDIANLNVDLKKRKAELIREDVVPDVRSVMAVIGHVASDVHHKVAQIIADNAFLHASGPNQRMDLRAKDLGFEAGFAQYQQFLRAVDKYAKDCGYGCLRNLCVPSAYLHHLRKTRPDRAALLNSEPWRADEAVYRQLSPYLLDRIIHSKAMPHESKVKFVVRSGFLYYIYGPTEHDWDVVLPTYEQGAFPKQTALQQAQTQARQVQADVARNGPPKAG